MHFTLESLYACESIGNRLRVYFLEGFMLRRIDRLQTVLENDNFACRHGSTSSSEDLDRRSQNQRHDVPGLPVGPAVLRESLRSHAKPREAQERPNVGRSVCCACRGMRDALRFICGVAKRPCVPLQSPPTVPMANLPRTPRGSQNPKKSSENDEMTV